MNGKMKSAAIILLTVGLIVMLAVGAAAEDHGAVRDSGECGDSLTWVLYEDGLLEISGTGKMNTYFYSSNQSPWRQYASLVTALEIEDGVETIGAYAFSEMLNIAGPLALPDSVTSIGNMAFSGCTSFTGDLIIPESVETIGYQAFGNCAALDGSLILSEGLREIGGNAFFSCDSLSGELSLPDSVEKIGQNAFHHCLGLTGLKLPAHLKAVEEGVFSYCEGMRGELVLPDGLESIGSSAFYKCGFTGALNLPESVVTIGDYAFDDCAGLSGALRLPSGLEELGDGAFRSCSGFTGELVIPSGLTKISGRTFFGCDGLEGTVEIPASVTEIGPWAFSLTGISTVRFLSEGPIKIDDYAFCLQKWENGTPVRSTGFTSAVFCGDAPTEFGEEVFGPADPSFVIYYTNGKSGWTTPEWNGYACRPAAEDPVDPQPDDGHTYRVLVLNFDPVFPMAENKRQHDLMDWWNDPHWLADEFGKDLNEVSHGYLNYDIVEWIEADELPRANDGRQYSLTDYYGMLLEASEATDGAYWSYPGWEDWGWSFDYDYYMTKYDVYNKVNTGEVDEVWIFSGPMTSGMYESHMMGKGAFWCNSPGEEKDTDLFVVYGFNYERGVGEMLEDAGHRAESILNEVFGWPDYTKDYSDFTDWEKFTVYDQLKPGKAGVGNVHFAPNSEHDYDWGNQTYVQSNCDDWKNYPDLTGTSKMVNCSSWGNGDIRLHHKWWFDLFPHTAGFNAESGKFNNWWVYFSLDFWNEGYTEGTGAVTDTGKCGDNLTWTLYRSGLLEISGTGQMWNWKYADPSPWNPHAKEIKSLLLNDGLTSIGSYAFYELMSLSGSLTVPDSVLTIGEYAFASCFALSGSLTIPDSVTEIGDGAFCNVSSLSGTLTFGKNVRKIGDCAFLYCNGVSPIVFEGQAPAVGYAAFSAPADKTHIKCYAGYVSSFESSEPYDASNGTWCGYYLEIVTPAFTRGDMSGDGRLDSNDAIYLLRHTMNPSRYPIAQSGDMNGDGKVDSNDAIYLLRHTMNPTRYPLK